MIKPEIVVGISGGSGSGKTTILHNILKSFDKNEICIVSQDNYYRPIEEQLVDGNGEVNFDLPDAINIDHFVSDMDTLMAGNSITKLEYTFNNEDKLPKEIIVQPAKVLLVEGLFIFHFQRIVKKLDLQVFIETSKENRLNRRIKRDQEERGYSKDTVLYQWQHHVEPAFDRFLAPYKKDCHLVIDNNESFEDGLANLKEVIQKKLIR